MKVLVTGATGFIGRRLVAYLIERGDDVVALTRAGTKHGRGARGGLPEAVRVAQGDVLDPRSLGNAGASCQQLFHLAALITFDPRRRAELQQVNAVGTANLLAAARSWGIERSVVVSSACTIGLSSRPEHVLDESAQPTRRLVARNPYLASKLETEQIALRVATEQQVVIVNPSTVYGPGDHSLNSGTLFRQISRAPLLPLPSGGGNVVDVDDVVRGIVAAAGRGQSGQRYLLAGENLSFAAIFRVVAAAVGRSPLFVPVPPWSRLVFAGLAAPAGRLSGGRLLTPQIVDDLFAFKYYSNAKASAQLGWQPEFSFEQSAARAWSFYRAQGLL